MKNAFLPKTLLCGVMATTFFLINCQKAPSRGIKANASPAAVDSSAGANKPTAQDVLVDCSTTFVGKLKASTESVAALNKEKISGLTEAEQTVLNEKIAAAEVKVKETLADITGVNADATGCVIKDAKTQKPTNYFSRNISDAFYSFVSKAKNAGNKIDEAVVSRADLAKKENEERKKQREAKRLAVGTSFVLSAKLQEAFNSNNVGAVYFKNGKIITTDTDLNKDLADTKLSMCQLGSGTGDVEKDVEAKVTSVDASSTKDVKSNRYKLTVVLMAGSVPVNLDCILADGKQNVYGEEFRNIFGDNLLTQDQVDAAKKKTMTVDQAKAIVAKKQESVDAASKAVEKAEAAVAAKEIEIKGLKDDKEKATATADKEKLVAKVEQLKKDLETAKKKKADADADLKKLEDAAAAKV